MIKTFAFIKRKKGLSLEEFSKYWAEKHAPLVVKKLPGMKRYIQNHAVKLGNREPRMDGVTEMWFEDNDAWAATMAILRGDEGKVLRDDEPNFMDSKETQFLVVNEKVIKG